MHVVQPSVVIIAHSTDALELLEVCGRVCYKSEGKITNNSAAIFIKKIRDNQHVSVIEHAVATVRFICDRGVSHELVRHRIASYSQESTRYCNYSKDKFGRSVAFIRPPCQTARGADAWERMARQSEADYFEMIDAGEAPEIARSVLLTSVKTEVITTMNFREWGHVFKLRSSANIKAHPQMREVMDDLYLKFIDKWPGIFME